jgi:hypothetical protein
MTFDEQLRRAFETLTERLHDGIRREVQVAVDEALVAAPVRPTADIPAGQRLLDAVRSLDRARSLSETLDTLANCAARETHRAAVLTVHGGRVHGWRFIGFGSLDQKPSVDLSLDDAGIIRNAVRANAVTSGRQAPAFAELPEGAPCVVLPLALAGEVVAVLYADEGPSQSESPIPNAAALEILTRYATRGIEALTAFKVARSLAATASAPEATRPAADKDEHAAADEDEHAAADEDKHAAADEDKHAAADEDEHVAARRYARLLVSEIKLYYEDSVVAGCRERDLSTRLGGEIARARMLYEQRVPAQVRQRATYFDDELVRTLANGDTSLLELRS